jgi:hypothetical protein
MPSLLSTIQLEEVPKKKLYLIVKFFLTSQFFGITISGNWYVV